MQARGRAVDPWPLQSWDLDALTLLALYYQTDLAVSRAQAAAVRAEGAVAQQRSPLALTPVVEHHSKKQSDSGSPWSVGVALEIPLNGSERRAAIREQYDYLGQAADLKAGSIAWAARAETRSRLVEYYVAQRTEELLAAELRERDGLVALQERRLAAGAASAPEINAVRLERAKLQAELQNAQWTQESALAALASAVGMPVATLRGLQFDFATLERAPEVADPRANQRTALQNRLDVRSKLLEYAAADTAVKLEIARQYPTFSLTPGYLWDQGDNVWSLAASVLLPAGGNRPAIELAKARREVAAQELLALQVRTISAADGALTEYDKAAQGIAETQQVVAGYLARRAAAQVQFESGYADRVELTLARIEALAAERNALSARLRTQQALGKLEDALQVPLVGALAPASIHGANASSDLVRR